MCFLKIYSAHGLTFCTEYQKANIQFDSKSFIFVLGWDIVLEWLIHYEKDGGCKIKPDLFAYWYFIYVKIAYK